MGKYKNDFSLLGLLEETTVPEKTVGNKAFSLSNQDGVLPAGSGTDNLLSADSSVVNRRGRRDVFNGALASLVVAREAPRVSLAILGDGEAVVSTSSNSYDTRYFYISHTNIST